MDIFVGCIVLSTAIYIGLQAVADAINGLARTFREVKVNVDTINVRHVRDE